MPQFIGPYGIGTFVHVDEDKSITAVVIGYWFKASGTQVQISWFNNGELREAWVDLDRVMRK